ncbi:dUTP diphosphatase [Candidatus Uhrbacteria bacterium]|nr:dUTP diphosphatase [Candidatus Uhrbacteria bacterium]
MPSLSVRIRRLSPDIPTPAYKTAGACGFDIAVSEGGVLAPGERRKFPTGLVVCVPEGYVLLLCPRSSNAKKGIQLANSVGVIDPDYCGPDDQLHAYLYNIGTEPYTVEKSERVMQGLFVPVAHATFEEVEDLAAPNRGGFGTTGR